MAISSLMRKLMDLKPDKKDAVIPPDNYELCPKCEGYPWDVGQSAMGSTMCPHCNGKGYVDWIEAILGTKKESITDNNYIPPAGSHNHHTHMHAGGNGTIGHASSISSIQGGPGITVQNVNSSQSGGCSISMIDPTRSLDFDYIKEELKDWLEEHIKNEVSRRVGDELMRRGVK